MPKDPRDPRGDDDGRPPLSDELEGWSRHAGLGLQYAMTLGLFAFVGWKLDAWLESEPWCLLAMVFLGFVGGTRSLVRKFPSGGGPTRKNE